MTPARIKTLLNQVHTGKIKSDMARVLNFIQKNPNTSLGQIEMKLKMIHQTASARVSDLLDAGLIEETGNQKKLIGFESFFRYQPDPNRQKQNAFNRKKIKYNQWVKKGITHFKEFINPEIQSKLCKK